MTKKISAFVLMLSFISAPGWGLTLHTSSFNHDQMLPSQYTCDGKGLTPELDWSDIPANTMAFALVLTDPDGPAAPFYHWVVYNIPKAILSLPEDITKIPPHLEIGKNSTGMANYSPPCPPAGETHHYIFTLYALDKAIKLPSELTGDKLLDKIKNHLLKKVELKATYRRK